MRCPRCKYPRYRTPRSDAFTQTRVRTLRCQRCRHEWETVETYDQRQRNRMIMVDKTHPQYNIRYRYMIKDDRVIKTIEMLSTAKSLPVEIDMFSEAMINTIKSAAR